MYNFGPAVEDEEVVFGACRPKHHRVAPLNDSIDDWVYFMTDRGIKRVCCLLDNEHLNEYRDLLGEYEETFGVSNVCHAPIRDFTTVDKETLHNTIFPFLDEAKRHSERTVVHCSAGSGRTGHVLALWLAHDRGYEIKRAVREVRQMGRSPLEASSRDDLQNLL